jgi:chromosomal replication initiation ATPase DnaA
MYLGRELTKSTLAGIDRARGTVLHARGTVLHAVRQVQARMAGHGRFDHQIAELTDRISRNVSPPIP